MAGDAYELRGLAVPGEIDRLHDLLERVATDHPELPAADIMMFETAVIEIANNVVEHGRPAGEVTWLFQLTVEPGRLSAELSDSGERLEDSDSATTATDMPDELSEEGRGLPLASAVLDDLSYRREADTNVWTMVRNWQPAG